jgi:methionyl-tRNA synthetase
VIWQNLFNGSSAGLIGAGASWLIAVILIWSLIWKGWALWRAARNDSAPWFIVLLILNTIGIVEIIYIFGFSGYGKDKKKS